jgi:hypothetical protein
LNNAQDRTAWKTGSCCALEELGAGWWLHALIATAIVSSAPIIEIRPRTARNIIFNGMQILSSGLGSLPFSPVII